MRINLFFIVVSVLITVGCGNNFLDLTGIKGMGGISIKTFATADTPGDVISVTAGSTTFDMIYANNATGTVIPMGVQDNTTATVNTIFFIGKTEITNSLFVEVLQWAKDHGKFSTSVGDPNGLDATTVKFGSQKIIDFNNSSTHCPNNMKISYNAGTGKFSIATGFENYPVACVSWYGAIMFCNWLTEMKDGNTTNVVYTGITTTWIDTNTLTDTSKKGYRLPENKEWFLAARYIDGISWLYGDHVSGDESGACYYDGINPILGGLSLSTVFGNYAWYSLNSNPGTGIELKPVGQKTTNALGLYDMNGNLFELCFDIGLSGYRVKLGGAYHNDSSWMQVGRGSNQIPDDMLYNTGFRLAKTQ